ASLMRYRALSRNFLSYLAQEEINPDDAFCKLQLTLCGLEIKLDVNFVTGSERWFHV
ncbi:hypothetical protein BGY98DRAFT_976081, partial [Russula aff. rugulosa BPL654]